MDVTCGPRLPAHSAFSFVSTLRHLIACGIQASPLSLSTLFPNPNGVGIGRTGVYGRECGITQSLTAIAMGIKEALTLID